MNVMIWLTVGGLLGWAASVLLGIEGRLAIALNVLLGAAGAFVGGWLFSGLFRTATIHQADVSVAGLFASFFGAAILVALVRAARLA